MCYKERCEGYNAFYSGMSSSNCPYPANSKQYKSWIGGFKYASGGSEDSDGVMPTLFRIITVILLIVFVIIISGGLHS